MLSCAQDYRPGSPGYQQHIWQATLSIDAMVFTNHPGSDNEKGRPNFWAGNGLMPRAVQFENVLVCVHRLSGDNAFPFSHAYFPRAGFDEVIEGNHWTFGRKGNGYIALFSQTPVQRIGEEEVRAYAPENIWVCEMGQKAQWDNFEAFVERVQHSLVCCDGLHVRYASPSQGNIRFGWEMPLEVDGMVIPLRTNKRFDTPYCQCDFLDTKVMIERDGNKVILDFDQNERVES
jgi:hypothetical protein